MLKNNKETSLSQYSKLRMSKTKETYIFLSVHFFASWTFLIAGY